MTKSKRFKFCGRTLLKGELRCLMSLIEMTTGRLGFHKKAFTGELLFWDAIQFVTGMRQTDGEQFIDAVARIRNKLLAQSPALRREMIEAVDKKAFFESVGVRVLEAKQAPKVHKVARVRNTPAHLYKPVTLMPGTAHQPRTAEKEEFYKSWEWRTIRMEAIKKHGRACQCCGAVPGQKYASGEAVRLCVDHIKPLSKYWELRLEPSNLQILCDECNMGKGNWDETDFRAPAAPDEWVIEDEGVSPFILDQLTDKTTGTLQ